MIVKVKRAKKNGWLGMKAFSNGKSRVGVSIDSLGNQITGLTREDEARFEDLLGFDKGYLRKANLREDKINYWTEYSVDFYGDEPVILDTEIPEQELAYLMLKAQKKVAKSVGELKTNGFAEFVIFNEEDEAIRENKRGENKLLAYELFSEMSTEDYKNILMLYGRPSDSTSPAMIKSQLFKLIDDDAVIFLSHAKDPQLKSKVFILNLVKAGIITKRGGSFAEYGSDTILAYSMDEMIKYLDSKANNSLLIKFKEALKNR